MNPRLLGFLLASSALFLSSAASAQQISNVEVGAASNTTFFGNQVNSVTNTGLVGRFTYNFTPSFSIDSEFGGYLANASPLLATYQSGGRPFLALAGPKAGIRTRRVDLFFKTRVGVLSYPLAFGGVNSALETFFVRRTYPALDVGGVMEVRTSTRSFLRFELGSLLVAERTGSSSPPPGQSGLAVVLQSGRIYSPWNIEVGAGYRLGEVRQLKAASSTGQDSWNASRFTAGAQYSLLTLTRGAIAVPLSPTYSTIIDGLVRSESSAGGFFTWDFSKHVGLDSSVFFFPRNMQFATEQDGGRMLEALGGIRVGARRGRLGVYGKARLGTLTFTSTAQSITGTLENPQVTHSPFTNVASDLGGIIEYYPSRRLTFRFDAGETTVFYRDRTINELGMPSPVPGFMADAMQGTIGIGYRFGAGGADSKH